MISSNNNLNAVEASDLFIQRERISIKSLEQVWKQIKFRRCGGKKREPKAFNWKTDHFFAITSGPKVTFNWMFRFLRRFVSFASLTHAQRSRIRSKISSTKGKRGIFQLIEVINTTCELFQREGSLINWNAFRLPSPFTKPLKVQTWMWKAELSCVRLKSRECKFNYRLNRPPTTFLRPPPPPFRLSLLITFWNWSPSRHSLICQRWYAKDCCNFPLSVRD